MHQELLELPSSLRVSVAAIAFLLLFLFFLKCLQNVEKCSRSSKTGTVWCNYSEQPLSIDKPTMLNLCLESAANATVEW